MTFKDAVKTCFRKYFTFSGRASRSEYWWFTAFCAAGGFVSAFVESFINAASGTPDGPTLLSGAFNLVTFIPTLSAGWRRMHDTGRSGLFLLYPLIAMVGFGTFVAMFADPVMLNETPEALFQGLFGIIVAVSLFVLVLSPFLVLWWLTRRSQPGSNQYGPNPHEVHP
jgi:uncharacterized membrane protein YhaH (DUF805 family)